MNQKQPQILESVKTFDFAHKIAVHIQAALGFYFYVSSSSSQRIQLAAYIVLTFITFCKIGDFIPNTTKSPPPISIPNIRIDG